MKTITTKQPWASLIVEGIKDVENRTWKCPEKYIGKRILIHAGMAKRSSLQELLTIEQLNKVNESLDKSKDFDTLFPKGAIIGSVEIVDCVINHESIWAEKTEIKKCDNCPSEIDGFDICCHYKGKKEGFIPYVEKPIYNWVLANPVLYDKPIVNVKGKLSFWETDYCNCEVCQKPFHIENMILSEDNWICEECLNEDLAKISEM